jgi:hypothetical protein
MTFDAPDLNAGIRRGIVMTASSHQTGSSATRRTTWRTPTLTEDAIADVTMNAYPAPGDDGIDQFVFIDPHYANYGLS